MKHAVLFDLDGVVIDSEPLYVQAEQRLFARYGIGVAKEDWQQFKGLSQEAFFDLIERRYRPDWNRAEVEEVGGELLREVFTRGLGYMPGFLPLARRLDGRYLLGLVTSSSREVFRFVSGLLPELPAIFPHILCGDEVRQTKPHPEPYLTMMARLGVQPEWTVVVEDSINGLVSARASGAVCVALAGSAPLEDLAMAHLTVHSLDEITGELLDDLLEG
ncbi:MAG: HAD family phosphatase [Bradymonadales bacterium]|nr:HAD family phosphatase [Bradymonadales bacterium]